MRSLHSSLRQPRRSLSLKGRLSSPPKTCSIRWGSITAYSNAKDHVLTGELGKGDERVLELHQGANR